MTIVARAGQYPDSLYDFGHIPGVSGGAIGVGAKIAIKYGYRGTRYLVRRFLKPKKYTYAGATGRGIAIGTGIASLIGSEDDLNGPQLQRPIKTPNRFQQGNRRRSKFYRGGRCNDRHRHRNCC